jgi:hypothetical protein
MMLVVIFAGLTFIVLEKFLETSYDKGTTGSIANESVTPTAVGVNLGASSYRDGSCSTIVTILNKTNNIVIAVGNYTQTDCLLQNTTQSCVAGFCVPPWRVSYSYAYSADTTASNAVNQTSNDLYDYGIGFLGIVILVVMVYLIISIVSGGKGGAK